MAFFVSNLGILFFRQILKIYKYEGVDFEYDQNYLKIQAQKYTNKAFLFKNTQGKQFQTQIQVSLFFPEILQLDKFEGADFKFDNIVFKFQSKATQMKHFVRKFRHLHYFTKFCNQTNSKALISNMTIFFQIPVQKYPNKAFLVRNLGILIFLLNFESRQI